MSDYKKNMNIGLAGEYLVASIMSFKGWDASLTLKNYPAADIFGYNPECDKHVMVQVKTTVGQSSYMSGLRLTATVTENEIKSLIKGPFIFVHYKNKEKDKITCPMPRIFILSREDMIKTVLKDNNDYFRKPRKGIVKELQPLAIKVKSLEEFENKWDNLWIG